MWSNFLAQTPHNIPSNDNNKDEENAKNKSGSAFQGCGNQ